MYLRKSVFTLLLILCNVFVVVAQTTADSLVLVTAHWNVTSMGKGVLCREAEFVSLYGVPQHVAILEIKPEQHRFDILIQYQARNFYLLFAERRGGGRYYCDRCTQHCIQWCRENR